jgi:hypothetical protein
MNARLLESSNADYKVLDESAFDSSIRKKKDFDSLRSTMRMPKEKVTL